MSDKNKKGKLTYFLDHPQIKRYPSPGNGNSPGFFNQLAAGKLSNPGGSQPSQPKSPRTQTRQPSSSRAAKPASGGSGQSAWQKAFSKGFRGE